MSTTEPDRSATEPAEPGPAVLTQSQIRLAIGGVMVGMLLSALDQTVVGTALPRIVSDLGGLDKLPWVVTAYLLTSMAVTPLWGKLSDLYGRRPAFQAAVVIFLLGSVLCGVAQSLGQLVVFRALQGVGGGGLFVLALSVIGDVVPPQERGRYQGLFGAVFGLASVGGPLAGGWFTDGPGWRWVFYLNVPVGLAALVVTTLGLRLPVARRSHRIDYAGAGLVVAAVTSLLLYLNWAGKQYGWGAPGPLALVAGFVLLTVAFVLVEQRAAEPVLPMSLFRNGVFSIGALFGFATGAAMFGGIVFLPVYLQVVQGMSPTRSGLAMLPAMFGLIATSMYSGQMISKTGKYKIFPICGALALVVAMPLLASVGVDTPYGLVALYSALFGAGVGLTMQTIVTAVQNSVPLKDMGAATSAANFAQRLGAAVGTAVLGAVLASRLATHLAEQVPADALPAAGSGARLGANVEAVHALAEPLRHQVLTAFSDALSDVFLTCVPMVLVALVVSFFLRESSPRPQPAAPAADQAGAAGRG
ncbi:MDR family MFS transporter [Kitasatospora sp. NPDC056138]|uniref:MDR family MFS transporter n=1 Tax=Kitasatospora sp. NPDC056138 TaxID=3345724 RepID=UPI0035DEF32B